MRYFINPKNELLTKRTKKAFQKHPVTLRIDAVLKKYNSIKDARKYQSLVEEIVKAARKTSLPSTKISIHPSELEYIKHKKPLSEITMWGGVNLKIVNVFKDLIQKLLVINRHGVLGFEIHKQKNEKLKVLEGYCLVFYSNHKSLNFQKGKIDVKLATAGDRFEFKPLDEHGVIALTDCTIEETSTNHLDDLFYIFEASQVA